MIEVWQHGIVTVLIAVGALFFASLFIWACVAFYDWLPRTGQLVINAIFVGFIVLVCLPLWIGTLMNGAK